MICGEKQGTDAGYQRHRKVGEDACDPCRQNQTKRLREWRLANPERHARSHRNSVLKREFGITLVRYEEMLAEQGGRCAICNTCQSQDGKSFAVDHCHATGKVRALLCLNCNVTLGKMGDNPSLLRAAADYLEAHH